MQLTGNQSRELLEALLDAYPTESSLARMLQATLGIRLGQVAGGSNDVHRVFNLINYFERSRKDDGSSDNRTEELIEAALRGSPANKKLQDFAREYMPQNSVPTLDPIKALEQRLEIIQYSQFELQTQLEAVRAEEKEVEQELNRLRSDRF